MTDLAMLYVQKGENEKALPLLNRLLKQYPTDAQGRADLGKVQYAMGQLEVAIRSLRKALELDSSLNRVHYQLATVYRALRRLELAKEELEKFETARKDQPEASGSAPEDKRLTPIGKFPISVFPFAQHRPAALSCQTRSQLTPKVVVWVAGQS